ncbi:MAG: tRNA pseudouridine(55) synthase TruB, partial [Defluviitaleaceae bacterium]|nr:tRNA pseudouridine(55) synthase TruB [Defluviitaleaceae bacterium]
MHGILNINKPKGITSHDVVYKVRKILRTKKVGHTGTLDPNATGVLPIVIGRATKLSDYIMGADKIYRAELILGKTTNTQDITGELLKSVELKTSEKLNSELGMKNLENAIKSFIGELYQTPPMFSAIKKDGVPLYKLARQNIEIERTHRLVNIKNITIHNVLVDRAIIEVHCSKGTYIRTLCHDIGEKLGFGA